MLLGFKCNNLVSKNSFVYVETLPSEFVKVVIAIG